jgi:3-oxoacyl-[acyl-carrier protein] reductase
MSGFKGRTALVTGSANPGGMGRSHVMLLAERGANVIAADIDRAGAEATAAAAARHGIVAHALVADIRDLSAFRAALEVATAAVGPVDILVNNAGVGGERLSFDAVDEAAFDRMFEVNVRGGFFLSQTVARSMMQRRWGRIINISSQFGIAGAANASHYAGAKAALIGFTKTWARELAPYGITVNAVAPGYIDTPMTARTVADPARLAARLRTVPAGRKGEPVDVSYAVAWLASDEASFVTGQVISPNGGETI